VIKIPADAWIGIAPGATVDKVLEGVLNTCRIKNRSTGVGEIVYVNFEPERDGVYVELGPGESLTIFAEDTSSDEHTSKLYCKHIRFLVAALAPGVVSWDILYTMKSGSKMAHPQVRT